VSGSVHGHRLTAWTAPLYPLQDFKALYKYCSVVVVLIIIIIIIIVLKLENLEIVNKLSPVGLK